MTTNKPTQAEVTQADYSEEALANRCLDFLEERAEVWMADAGVQRMFNAIASVFEKYASQDIMDRFRDQLGTIGCQCYVEGALRAWEEIAAQQRAIGQPLPPPPGTEPRPADREERLLALLGEARDRLSGVLTQFDHAGCTCTFPSDDCCSYASGEAFLTRIDAELKGEG